MTTRDHLPAESDMDGLMHRAAAGRLTGTDGVSRVLRAAVVAPDVATELSGEEAAVAAFRAARTAGSRGRRRMTHRHPVLRRVLTLKGATVAAVVLAGAGAVAATATGVVPDPLAATPDGPGAKVSTSRPNTAPGPSGSGGGTRPGGSLPPSAPASGLVSGGFYPTGTGPGTELLSLCQDYLAVGPRHTSAIHSTLFPDLVTQAGGRPRVTTFCLNLVAGGGLPGGSGATPTPTPTPTPSSTPPDGDPSGKPTGDPSDSAPAGGLSEAPSPTDTSDDSDGTDGGTTTLSTS
jgi:hypothetical protein